MPSAPLVPENDPTLLFTNAGMVPFKDIFTGKSKAPTPRATSSQKCIRAGGKHNDLDNVGYTARHHTFFEMLGNFSFGDYFKEKAISLAWEFLCRELALPKERLLITTYADDDEAYLLWQKISGLPDSQIIKIATNDNFWSMGETGPCGPCSEIFYDHGDTIAGGPPGSPNEDGDRFVEIWNLVFMQFEQQAQGERLALPQPSIDTGMGLERVAAVMQGTHNNYETDIFTNIIKAAEDIFRTKATQDNISSFRVIADHVRAISFLISDGVQPANEGRGYVLRRILRRAMRHIHLLGIEKPILYRLQPVLETEMGTAYPELSRAQATITETLKYEEERFAEMLTRGLGLLEKELESLKQGEAFSGEVAFRLYDTFGFPLDLTQDALRRKGVQVDVEAFNQALETQRGSSRQAWKGSGELATQDIFLTLADTTPPTNFTGYEENQSEAKIIAILQDGARVETLNNSNPACILLDKTPFYAESGGQVGDRGKITTSNNLGDNFFLVEDTQKQAKHLHIHYGKLEKGKLATGDSVHAAIDVARRETIRANHSATHLMNEALRQVLGEHVAQKGSLVNENHLRFDFSHQKPVSDKEINKIENIVNEQIRINQEVRTKEMPQEEARKSGAIAMFGEKYDERVRVLFMGGEVRAPNRDAFSIEFCGGTHVRSTGDIALFKIIGQSSVGSGVRRLVALTGKAAFDHLRQQENRLNQMSQILKVMPDSAFERLKTILEENKQTSQSLRDAKRKLALAPKAEEKSHVETIQGKGVKFMHRVVEDMDMKSARQLIDEAKRQLASGVVALLVRNSDKGNATLMVGITKDLTDRYDAVVLAKMGAAVLGGSGGGGRAELAQAGGPNGDRASEAIQAVRLGLS